MSPFRFVLPLIASVALVAGCSDDKSTSPTDSSTGMLSILLTDAPAAFDSVNVTFSEVAVNAQTDSTRDGWIIIKGEPQTFNLLTLSDGLTATLGAAELDAGRYGQIRLKLTAAEVVVDGETFPLDVPSGSTSGLKLGGGFTIEPGVTTELVLDFDAARSITVTGKNGGYKLKPVIRLVASASTGAIHGRVLNPEANPVAYAVAGADTVASSMVKTDTGRFTLAFLPSGTYAVSIADTLGNTYGQAGVVVTAGETMQLGEITLSRGVSIIR